MPDKTIVDLLKYGSENAISRNILTAKCIAFGLVDRNAKDKDKAMRDLITEARNEYPICNIGKGYFIATGKDEIPLRKSIKSQRSRIRTEYRGLRVKEKLLEDIKAGRL